MRVRLISKQGIKYLDAINYPIRKIEQDLEIFLQNCIWTSHGPAQSTFKEKWAKKHIVETEHAHIYTTVPFLANFIPCIFSLKLVILGP